VLFAEHIRQIAVLYRLGGALSIVPLSGVLVWIALACLALSLLGADRVGDRLMTRVIGHRPPGR
jgi:hypothetical protein